MTLHQLWAGYFECVLLLFFTVGLYENSYWTSTVLKILSHVYLLIHVTSERWQCQEQVFFFPQPSFPSKDFAEASREDADGESGNESFWELRSRSKVPSTPLLNLHLSRFLHLGTELMERGTVLQVIQLFLQCVRALDVIFNFGELSWQQMWHLFHEGIKRRKEENHTCSSAILEKCVLQIWLVLHAWWLHPRKS